MSKEKRNSILAYLDGMLFVGGILLLVYALKGVAPFGSQTVDFFDGSQVGMPNLFQLWDVLHRRVSPFYDPYEAMGTSILPVYLPDYWLIYFWKRAAIRTFPSFLLLLRMMGSCCSMQFALERITPKLSPWGRAFLGVLYAGCGFFLNYYSLLIWMDFVMLFPFVLLGAEELCAQGKRFWLVAGLSVLFALNVYMAAFVLLFVLFYGGIHIFLCCSPEKQRLHAWRLALSTIQSVLLSAALMLPVALIELGSDRAGLSGGTLLDFFRSYLSICSSVPWLSSVELKANMLCGLWVPTLWLVFRLCQKALRRQKQALADLLCLIGLLIPIVSESVNLIWHFGSYHLFPMRFGYFLSALAAVLLAKEWEHATLPKARLWGWIGLLLLVPSVQRCLSYSQAVNTGGAVQAGNALHGHLLAMNTLFWLAVYLLLHGMGNRRFLRGLLVLAVAFHLGVECYAYIAPANRVGDFTQQPDFLDDCAALNQEIGNSGDPLSRWKNGDTSLNNNYPLVLGQPALSGWTDCIWTDTLSGEFRNCFIRLGYANDFTRILDQGGTLFSDALIGVKRQISNHETFISPDNYTLVQNLGAYNLYDARFTLPAGLPVDREQALELAFGEDILENQNALWKLVSGSSDTLLIEQFMHWQRMEDGSVTSTLALDGDVELYLSYTAPNGTQLDVYVNDGMITVPYYLRPYNKAYPTPFANGLLDLGCPGQEEVTLTLRPRDEKQLTEEDVAAVRVMALHRDALAEFCGTAVGSESAAAGRHMAFSTTAGSDGKLLLLPVQYSAGWHCTRNGQAVTPLKVAGAFLALPMEEGACRFELSFFPVGFRLGILLSAIGLLLTAVLFLMRKKHFYARLEQYLGTLCRPLLGIAVAAAILLVYGIPLVCSVLGTIASVG